MPLNKTIAPVRTNDTRWSDGSPTRRYRRISIISLALISLALSCWGVSWGLPGVASWAPDTVAGTRTLRTIGTWPDRWPTHYPPLHFFANQIAYQPILANWQAEGRMMWGKPPTQTGDRASPGQPGDPGVVPLFSQPAEQIGSLILVSRLITVGMSLITVLCVVACGRRLFGDWWSGFFAGLTLVTCAEWVFFSHLGNLDAPHMMWFALSLYFCIRACQTDTLWHFFLLGVMTALSVSTKDAVAGIYVGIALVVAGSRVQRKRSTGVPLRTALSAPVHWKMWVAFISFSLPYATIHGLWTHSNVYVERLKYYLVGPGTSQFNQSYEGPIWLARETLAVAAKALGWPMLAFTVIAVMYGLVRHRRQSLFLLVPCATYYILVCSTTGMVYARMLFPVYICLALLVGRCCVSWLSWTRMPAIPRYASIGVLFLSSFGYCVAVDLELTQDTRHRAERWLAENIQPDEVVGVFSRPQYLPRFFAAQRRAQPLAVTHVSIARSQAPFLLLTSHNYQDFDAEENACMNELLSGNLDYDGNAVATFSPLYLPPRRHWLAVAGWGTRGAGKISPEIRILKRKRR